MGMVQTYNSGRSKEKGPELPPALSIVVLSALPAVAHEAQQEQEHVHEVEIEAEGAENGAFHRHLAIANREVDALDDLRIVGGQAGEHEHANRAHQQVE